MPRFPVLKALSGSQKVFKLLGVGLDRRQGLILLGSIFCYWLLYKQLSKVILLTTPQAVVLFAPLVVLAVAVAFVRHERRHLDWWAQMKLRNHMREEVLLWKRTTPGSPSGQKRPLRDSIQEALGADRILWEMLRTKDGAYLLVFEVEPVALGLAGDDEKQRVWAAGVNLYNRLDFPVVEMSRSKEGSVNVYARSLKERVRDLLSSDDHRLARFARAHLSFLEGVVPRYNVFERRGYVILPYRVENPEASRKKKRPGAKDAAALQREAEGAYRVLSERAEIVFDAFGRFGARLRLLTDLELLAFLKGQARCLPENADEPPMLWEPVTLEVGGYESASPARQEKLLAAAERFRKHAPPAMGVGDLTLADRISPDAVRVHADYLRVGQTYHATLFLYEFPPDVGFGDLQGLLHIPGRVKVVKYVTPLPQEKAVGVLGGKVAELEAAEYTASDGNVIATQQRAHARASAASAMDQLLSGEQHYFEMSLLIHCEADSKDELNSLVETVRTRLAGLRAEALLAREESFEGFKSCLPLGTNHLSARYASKGMLTHPLACLFIYGTYQVNHENGVLLGINPESGSLVVLDSRRLMNPHMVVLGTSGGGKTQTVKALSTRLRMRGHRVVCIDPEGNSGYGRVARALGGEYVVFGIGTPAKFNPCDLNADYLNLSLLASADEEEEDPEAAMRRARASALDGKVLMLTRLVSLMISGENAAEGLSAGEQGLIDRLWGEAYREKGITGDPDTHHNEPPTFPDFFRRLGEAAEDNPALGRVREKLYPWESGALKTVFDGHTNVDLGNKYLVLQIAGVKGRAKAAIMYALLDFLSGRLSNPEEPADCFVDEFWSLLKYPMAAEFAEELWRSGRARNASMVAITQEMEEFLSSEYGRVIMRISASQIILRQQKKTAEILDDFLTLSAEQKQAITNAQGGEGYLVVEGNEVPLYVVCSEEEHRLFNTDPAREAEYASEEKRRLAEARRLGIPAPGAGEEPPPEPSGAPGPKKARRLTAHGRARALISSTDPDFVPEEGDYEDVAATGAADPRSGESVSGASEADAGRDERRIELAEAAPGEAPVYAVVGEGAPIVGYNLAGLLAAETKESGRRILFVDAHGQVTEEIFEGVGQRPPDDLLVGGNDLEFADYIAYDPHTNLCVMVHPTDPHSPARSLIARARETFDAVIVACAETPYANDWLKAARRALAADTGARGLAEAVRRAEEVWGADGTLISPMGSTRLTPDLMSRAVFRLPAPDSEPMVGSLSTGEFASLSGGEAATAFRAPLRELLLAEPSGLDSAQAESGDLEGGEPRHEMRTGEMATVKTNTFHANADTEEEG